MINKKLKNISAFFWAVSCYSFASIIIITTKGMTRDPNFSGGPETPWLIPMLTTIGLGFLSFGIMLLTWLISLRDKSRSDYKAPFGITTTRSVLSVIVLIVIIIVFAIGYRYANTGYKKSNYTGQQLFDAMNEYRATNSKQKLALDEYICDNLVARYLKVKGGDVGHEGFEEWVKNEEIDKRFSPIAEIYTKDTSAPKDAIDFWNGSPGHRLTLLGDFTVGCAYANEGVGVAVLGNPISN